MEKRKWANLLIGFLFAKLYEAWPKKLDFDYEIASNEEAFKEENSYIIDIFDDLMDWLVDNNYIKYQNILNNTSGDGAAYYGVVLTEKGLAVLDGVPESLGRSFGKKLSETATDLTTESAKQSIVDLIGQLLGSFIKGVAS